MLGAADGALENQRRELCSVKQRKNLKVTRGQVKRFCKNISREFGAICQKFNKKSKSIRLRVVKKLEHGDMNCLSLLLKDHIIRLRARQADLVRPKVHQKLSRCDMNVNI